MDLRQSRFFAESWNVAYRLMPEGSILGDRTEPFRIVANPIRYWAADPMVFQYKGKTYLFAELFDYITSKGVIGVSEYRGNNFSKWKVIIREKTHLSYPFVFIHEDKVYMIPESSESRCVPLYVAEVFPIKWRIVKYIERNVEWVDTTIYRNGNEYVGFTETREIPPVDYIITLDDTLSIKTKRVIKNSGDGMHRCGGRIFEYRKEKYMVNQDCSDEYGGALFFRKLDEDLNEVKSKRISPDNIAIDKPFLKNGMHTYTATEYMEVIDVKTRRFSLLNFVCRVIGKIKMQVGRKEKIWP